MSFTKFFNDTQNELPGVIKSGLKVFDQIFGGGIPMNNLVVIELDEFNVYSNLLIRCIASNSIYEKQKLVYVSSNSSLTVNELLRGLPVRQTGQKPVTVQKDMEIAFRYNYMPSLANTSFIMDYGKKIDETEIKEGQLCLDQIKILDLEKAYDYLTKVCQEKGSHSSLIPSIFIFDNIRFTERFDSSLLCQTFYKLKSFSRNCPQSVFFVTYQPEGLSIETKRRICNLSDSTLQVEALDPSQSSVYGPEFKALLHVHKVTKTMTGRTESIDGCVGIKVEKSHRYFYVDNLFLHPETSETPSRLPKSVDSSNIF